MSIATTAPQKFELQDLACVELMLRFALAGSATFTVESGVEDGDLILGASPAIHYEIQVKGSDNPVSVNLLAKWLLHFPAYRDDETVLERLLNSQDRWFVLVASGRCRDDLEALRVDAFWKGEAVSHVPQNTAREVIAAFGVADPDDAGDTDLHTRRIAHRDKLARKLGVRAVAKALRRVVILEQATKAVLEAQIQAHLVRRGMPLDRIGSSILALRQVVEAARGDKADVMVRLNTRLDDLLPGTLLPAHYVKRGDEHLLLADLATENSLLLSGISRSGKSMTARWLGAQFETQGFEVRAFRDIQGATSFLEDPVSASRLAILDDPLGRVDTSGNPGDILSRLGWLVSVTRTDRRLIVAQGQEALIDADDTRLLADIETGGRTWRDLSEPGAPFLRALWRAAAARSGFPAALIEPVAASLGPKPDLGAGALDFLARSGDRFAASESVDTMMRFARRDAKATGQSLRHRLKSFDAVDALLLASSEQETLDPIELAFVQGQGGDTLPAYTTHSGRSSRMGSTPSLTRPLPSYDAAPATDAVTRADLDLLERLHVIDLDRSRRVGFSHGFYRQAIAATLANPTMARADSLLTMLRRGLFARSGPTSKAAARNLDLLLDLVSGTPDGRARVFRTAIEGLRCYFVATRDICFQFLMRNATEASGALEDSTLNSWINAVTFINFTDIQWHGDDAIIPIDGEVDGFMNWVGPKRRPRAFVQPILDRLAGDGPLPSAREASEALSYFWHNAGRMTDVEAERLFSLDEAVIRRETAYPYTASIVSRADRKSVWEEVVLAVATEPGAPHLAILFDHVARSDEVGTFRAMIREGAKSRPDETFELLMGWSMWRANHHLGPGWETLLAHAPDAATREAWLDEIADAAPKLFEEWKDIEALFPSKADAAAIEARLKRDALLLQYVGTLMELDETHPPIDPALWSNGIRAIGLIVEKLTPAILGPFDACIHQLRRMGTIPSSVEDQINAARVKIIDAREPIWLRYRLEHGVTDWIG
jgi:hypothetical protein